MKGRSTNGTTGLGTVEVSGRSRVPSPPARMSACTRLRARAVALSDALVLEAGRPQRPAVEEAAPVDDEVAGHALPGRVPVERAELRPLGDEDHGIRVLERPERFVGE